MTSSTTIATIFGTKVRVHFTFPILLAWIAIEEGLARGAQAAVTGVIFVLLLFVCVVAHEFGHIIVARHYGGRTRDILLLPIGGLSRMESIPEEPRQELAVALAGPAVSIAIAFLLMLFVGIPTEKSIESASFAGLLPRLAATNLFLALFNLVPAFPMDGGRAIRALFALRLGRARATRIAARMGHAFAALFVFLGLIGANPILLLIGIFIYFGASAESTDTQLRQLAQTLKVADVMRTNVRSIREGVPLSHAIDVMLQAGQHAIPVVDARGSCIGVATKDAIIRAVHRLGRSGSVDEAVDRSVPVVRTSDRLVDALDLMQGTSPSAVLVVGRQGELAGVVTADTLADLMLVQAAPGRQEPGAKPRPTSLEPLRPATFG